MCVCSGVHESEVNPSYCSRKTWDRKSRNKVGSCSFKPITPRTHLLPLWCHGGIYTPSTTPMIAIWDIFYFYYYCLSCSQTVRGHFSVSQSEFFMKTQSLTNSNIKSFVKEKNPTTAKKKKKNQRTKTNKNSENQKAATLLKLWCFYYSIMASASYIIVMS